MVGPTFVSHEVLNQPPPASARNLFDTDTVLIGAVESFVTPEGERELSDLGAFYGSLEVREFARLLDAHPPVLRAFDAYGRRIDHIEMHPAWLALNQKAAMAGLGISLWDERSPDAGRRHVMRTTRLLLAAQGEPAHLLPWSLSSAAIATLLCNADLADEWLAALLSRRHDYRTQPWQTKGGATLGLAVTEKQGPMENGAVITDASRLGNGRYALTGHKAFVAHPTADAFIMLADAPGGISTFLVPRLTPDGRPNGIVIDRLSPLMGLRGLPVADIELRGAQGYLIGQEGRAAQHMAETWQTLWLDQATLAVGTMRRAMLAALHHLRHRKSGPDRIADLPLMTRTLADMALDIAAAETLCIRIAAARDSADSDRREEAFVRLATPAAKYWTGKICPALVTEAAECLGAVGLSEDGDTARILRDAPFAGVMFGPGNAMVAEIVRIAATDPEAIDAVLEDVAPVAGVSGDIIRAAAKACTTDHGSGRILAEQIAVAVAAGALHRFAPRALTEAFVDTRLAGPWRSSYGMLDSRFDARGIVNYTYPAAG